MTPEFSALPSAIWLGSDAKHHYEIYRRLFDRAGVLLAAGHSVVLDATFLDPALLDEAEAVARRGAVPFTGLWLDVPPAVLLKRVAARTGSLSDADEAVLRRQLETPVEPEGWLRLDASANPHNIFTQAREALRLDQTLE